MLKLVRSPKQGQQSEEDPLPMENNKTLIELAAQIVAAYVGHNAVEQADLPKLIGGAILTSGAVV